jgi:hypothetical protein
MQMPQDPRSWRICIHKCWRLGRSLVCSHGPPPHGVSKIASTPRQALFMTLLDTRDERVALRKTRGLLRRGNLAGN